MSLKITQEPMDNRQLSVTIEVPQERIDQELRKAARKLGRDYRIPGFRKGKAPYNVVVQSVGMPALYDEFLNDLGQEVFKQAVADKAFEPYAIAALEEIDVNPVRYKLIVPLEPEVDLGDYRSLRVEEAAVEVAGEEIDKRLLKHQEQYATWEEADRPTEYGDMMTIDVHGILDEPLDGDEETVVLNEIDWEVTPDEDDPMDPPGLDEALLGLTAGDKKEVSLSWPEDSQSIYAGNSALFKIEVKKVQVFKNAELTDELAQMIGPDFETVAALRDSVNETLLGEAESEAEEKYLEDTMTQLVEGSTLVYPPVVIEDQLDVMMGEFEQQIKRAGIENLEAYFEATGQEQSAFRDSQREQATLTAERNLVISELINAEGIGVTDDDIDARINEMVGEDESDQAKSMTEMFRNGPGRPVIESQVLQTKAIDRLLAIARGEEIPDPAPVVDASDATADEETASEDSTSKDVEGGSSEAVADAIVEPTADADEPENSGS